MRLLFTDDSAQKVVDGACRIGKNVLSPSGLQTVETFLVLILILTIVGITAFLYFYIELHRITVATRREALSHVLKTNADHRRLVDWNFPRDRIGRRRSPSAEYSVATERRRTARAMNIDSPANRAGND